MTRETFVSQWERLTQAFGTTNPDAKAKVYFEELQRLDDESFGFAVSKIIRESDRFPTIAKILEMTRALQPQENVVKADCIVCDGYGWVIVENVAYRGTCRHGDRLADKIKRWPFPRTERIAAVLNERKLRREVYGPNDPKMGEDYPLPDVGGVG